MNIAIEVKGLDKILALPGKGRDGFRNALLETAKLLERHSKIALTVGDTRAIDTGRLRASIGGGEFTGGGFTEGIGRTVASTFAIIQPQVHYAVYVHEGTTRMRPRPFFVRAIETGLPDIERALKFHIDEALK